MTHLDADTMKDLWDANLKGNLPFLLTVYNPDIVWTDEEKAAYNQEDHYINFVSDNVKVKYKDKVWLPCAFTLSPPEKDGKKLGSATVSISALDARVKGLLRTILLPSEVKVVAVYAKQTTKDNHTIYKYKEINSITMTMMSSSSNQTVATFNLTPDLSLQQSVPYDTAVEDRVPSATN